MGRAPCCDKAHVKKGPWSPEEDAKLKEYIEKHGTGGNWIAFPQKADLRRCGKSCRLRWLNYLRPNIKHGEFSDAEDRIICSLFASIGSRWSIIAAQLPGRTDNDIKNYWNTKLKKKLLGIAPSSQNQKRPLQATTYPSISLLQSSYSLPSSAAEYKCSNNSYFNTQASSSFTGYEPISIPSNLLNTSTCSSIASASAILQAPEGYVVPTLIGGEASCSSSDGSCNNQISHGREILEHDYGVSNGEHMGFQSYFYNGVDNVNGYPEKANGFYGETPIDYSSLEEFKQLISTNIFVDGEKVMY